MGDDDPFDAFYRYENGRVVLRDYAPDYDEAEDGELPDVYTWWHADLPPEIKEGFINQEFEM